MSLTNRNVDNIDVGKVIWDEKLQGFGARKQSANGSISFILKTRIGERQSTITIGLYGVLTIQAARAEAPTLLGMISSGEDPIEVKDLQDFRVRDIANAWLEPQRTSKAFQPFCSNTIGTINPTFNNCSEITV